MYSLDFMVMLLIISELNFHRNFNSKLNSRDLGREKNLVVFISNGNLDTFISPESSVTG